MRLTSWVIAGRTSCTRSRELCYERTESEGAMNEGRGEFVERKHTVKEGAVASWKVTYRIYRDSRRFYQICLN
jgi:hypothetical protein